MAAEHPQRGRAGSRLDSVLSSGLLAARRCTPDHCRMKNSSRAMHPPLPFRRQDIARHAGEQTRRLLLR